MRKNIYYLLLLCLGCLTVSSVSALDIVKNGKPHARIVLPDNPSPFALYAAKELEEHIRKASGAKLEIIPEKKAGKPGNYIYVGPCRATEKAGIDVSDMKHSEGIIKVTPYSLYLAGKDAFDKPKKQLAAPFSDFDSVGTLFAVYEWLDKQLQVKWLWPGKLGTSVPRLENVTSGHDGETKVSPKFIHSKVRYGSIERKNWRGAISKQAYKKTTLDTRKWIRRHRFSRSVSLEYGHAFTDYWKKFGKTHPEWFAKRPDGVRAPASHPQFVQMCVSNPALHKHIVSNWLKTRTTGRASSRPWINCAENDKFNKHHFTCTCKACRAWDAENAVVSKGTDFAAEDIDVDKTNSMESKRGKSHSDRYVRFWLAVQKEARKYDPGATIATYAYKQSAMPPVEAKLNENIVVGIVPPYWLPVSEDRKDDFKKIWKGWAKTGASLFYRPNHFWNGYCMPFIFARQFGEEFRFAAQNRLIGTDLTELNAMWGVQGPNLYMLGRMNENFEMTPGDILREYYSAFGPAAKEVQQYFEYWEKVTAAGLTPEFRKKSGALYRLFYMTGGEIFTPETFKTGFKLLDAADKASANDTLAKARVEFLRKGLINADLSMRTAAAFLKHKNFPSDKNLEKAYFESLEKLWDYRKTIENDNVVNLPFLHWSERQHWDKAKMDTLLSS
jgi:hypothetical protein